MPAALLKRETNAAACQQLTGRPVVRQAPRRRCATLCVWLPQAAAAAAAAAIICQHCPLIRILSCHYHRGRRYLLVAANLVRAGIAAHLPALAAQPLRTQALQPLRQQPPVPSLSSQPTSSLIGGARLRRRTEVLDEEQ